MEKTPLSTVHSGTLEKAALEVSVERVFSLPINVKLTKLSFHLSWIASLYAARD